MRHFADDDAGYLGWLADHPSGFVLNTGRNPSAAHLMLHQASCRTISGAPARGAAFTGDYSKLCGTRDELEAFARQLGGAAQACGLCLNGPASRGRRGRDGGTYGPLRDHLAGQAGSEVTMTFAQVERLVGPLPDSARAHRAWWANDTKAEALAWRAAGWRVQSVDQAAGQVIFARGAGGGTSLRDKRQVAGWTAPAPYIDAQVIAAIKAQAGARRFDHAKLLRLTGELNDNYGRGNAYAAHALLRAILDHVPPLPGCADFKAVASSYPWSRTDKAYRRKLLDFKLQADDALHRQISPTPDLLGLDDMPPRTWVNRLLQGCTSQR